MELLHAAVLGIIQGLTEFLPISSSGHLALIPWLTGWQDLGPTFDVALHLGTLFALVLFFWRDWIDILLNWRKPLFLLIIIGCVPAAILGFLFEKYFETIFRSPMIIAIFIIAMGIVMGVVDKVSKKKRDIDTINLKDALFIGFAQAFALMPGVSRSGITITAGLYSGLTRESAARFSFLLAMPITAGAGLLKLLHIIKHGLPSGQYSYFAIGIFCSTIIGFIAIKYLLRYLQQHTLSVFVWYRILFGTAVLITYFVR